MRLSEAIAATSIALTIFLAGQPFAAGQDDAADVRLQWLQDFLQEFSVVADIDPDSGAREIVSTRLQSHPEAGRVILSYQRSTYATGSPRSLERRQVIQYTVTIADVNRSGVETASWTAPRSGETFWMVSVPIQENAKFVPYTNLVEMRLDDGSVDVTSSRGRVRSIALGYFSSESVAKRFAEAFETYLIRRDSGRDA